MRILHTADWHLGRIFHGEHLTAHQAHVLDQFVAMAREVRPHAVIIAGDVYDRAVPPPDAVALLDDVLSRLVSETDAHVILIAGNHDSAARIGFGARLLAAARVHVRGRFDPAVEPVTVEDDHGPVHILPLPFLEPLEVRNTLNHQAEVAGAADETAKGEGETPAREVPAIAAEDQAAAMRAALAAAAARLPGEGRRVLVAHATVAGALLSDSERPLAIGGVEAVPPDLLAGFHYVALGHLHRPQAAGAETVRYAGSLLKYSFSEAGHEKSATFVEMDGEGRCAVELLPFSPKRDVRILTGTLEALLERAAEDPGREDWLLARLEDAMPPPDAFERLRQAWPNLLQVELRPAGAAGAVEGACAGGEGALADAGLAGAQARDLAGLFAAFHEAMTGEPLSPEGMVEVQAALEDMRRAAREA